MPDELTEIVTAATAWARSDPRARAVALVGSRARGTARSSSDVDLVVLSTEPAGLASEEAWLAVFGADLVGRRSWGALVERRLRRPSGVEVDVGIVAITWASTSPIDAGTRRVIAGGCRVLYDPDGLLTALCAAVERNP